MTDKVNQLASQWDMEEMRRRELEAAAQAAEEMAAAAASMAAAKRAEVKRMEEKLAATDLQLRAAMAEAAE